MTRRLLVVDDQVGLARVIQRVAEDMGYETMVTNQSSDAIDLFLTFNPDVVILDMIMPDKDGIEVLNEMALTGAKPRLVLTSGLSDGYLRLAEGVARFHQIGTVNVLRKPFRREELTSILR
jgi:CheY-like chemotaxis protein